MNKKRICFFDVDGTLTLEDKEAETIVPASTVEALNRAHQAGVLLFVNTGRPMSSVSHTIQQLPFDGYVCGCGTSLFVQGEKKREFHLPLNQQKELMEKLNSLSVACVYEGTQGCYFVNYQYHPRIMELYRAYEKEGFIYDGAVEDYQFEKFGLFKTSEQNWPDLSFLSDFNLIERDADFYEIVPKSCSKGKAILDLLEQYQIPMENCYVFGDSTNDLPMLDVVENSIIMGNASKEVQSHAKYVTEKASQDGLFHIMEKLGLLK